jgi:hypothetical protein
VLLPEDEKGSSGGGSKERIYASSDAAGEYRFQSVLPGLYVVAVNPDGVPYVRDESAYAPTYYPGGSRERASPVSAVMGQEVRLKDFKLPPRLPIVTLEVVVRDADGRPAAYASVLAGPVDEGSAGSHSSAEADADGRALLRLYKGTAYRVHAESYRGDPRVYSEEVQATAADSTERLTLTLDAAARGRPSP